MLTKLEVTETCAVCGRAIETDRVFCHVYENRGPVNLCRPSCVDVFLRSTGITEEGEVGTNRIAALISEWSWREYGR